MRLFSLEPATTNLVLDLGGAPLLVGRTDESNGSETVDTIPSAGAREHITEETLRVFEPDLLLLSEPLDAFTTFKIWRLWPASMDHLYFAIRDLGLLLDRRVEADLLVHDLQIKVERLRDATSRFRKTPVAVVQEVPTLHTHLIADIVALAGGEVVANPAKAMMIIVIGSEEHAELTLAKEEYAQSPAARTERVYALEPQLFHPNARIVHGLATLAKILHGVTVRES
jgi:ABC-type hemin transport system substrate-binding protein